MTDHLNDVRLWVHHGKDDASVHVVANFVNDKGEPIATLGSASMSNPEEMERLRLVLHAVRMTRQLGEKK